MELFQDKEKFMKAIEQLEKSIAGSHALEGDVASLGMALCELEKNHKGAIEKLAARSFLFELFAEEY